MADDLPQDRNTPTPAFEKPPDWAVALVGRVTEGFRDVREDVRSLSERLGSVEARVDLHETRMNAASIRVKEVSSHDLDQDARLAQALTQLADEKSKREKLEAEMVTKKDLAVITENQTSAIVEGVKAAAKNPTVQKLAWALAGLAFTAINVATTYLAAKGH